MLAWGGHYCAQRIPPTAFLRTSWPSDTLTSMCNLYTLTKGQQAIRDFTLAMLDGTGSLRSLPAIFLDIAPIARTAGGHVTYQ